MLKITPDKDKPEPLPGQLALPGMQVRDKRRRDLERKKQSYLFRDKEAKNEETK